MKKLFVISLALSMLCLTGLGQNPTNPCRKSTEGTDFWFGFMEGRWDRNGGNNHYVEITVSAREATNFTITIGNSSTPYGTFSVGANDSRTERIPWNLVEAIGSEKIENKAINLVAEKPVNVYALNFDRSSADVALIYPIQSLGTEYYAMTYTPSVENPTTGRNSEFMVVATEDSTMVEITPTVNTDMGQLRNSTDTIFLNKGQLYQVQAYDEDLTGSFVKSDKSVAFFAGSHGTRIPSGVCCWDHLYEQIPPIHSWGREYYAVPLKSREQDRYRIMAAKNETTIYINGVQRGVINKGEFLETVLYHYEPSLISSDKPILVAQFSQSQQVDNSFTGGNGDPFMIILSSVSQTKNDVTFVAYSGDQISSYYLNIISLTSEINNLRLNGSAISGFQSFPNSEYSFAQVNIGAGSTNRLYNTNPDRGFLAYVYGYGGVESYGYGVGFNLDLVLDLGASIEFDKDTLLLCYGETRTLDAGPYFDTYNWESGDTTQTLTITSGGKYKVHTTTVDGCELEDSIFVFMSHPKVELDPQSDSGCAPYSVELNGGEGFAKYLWQDGNNDSLSNQQIYTASQTGEYRITVTNPYNCVARDTMNLEVFPVPDIEIDGSSLVCGELTSNLSASITNAPTEIWNYPGSFSWQSEPELSFSNEMHQGVSLTAPDWGTYKIFYQIETTDGCAVGDTFMVHFQPIPTTDFKFVESPDDECKGYTREVLYTGNATENANFYWDYGGSKVIEEKNWNNFTVSLGAFNSNPYISLYVEENGCWSADTASTLIGANPQFALKTESARGCDSMTVLFSGELEVEDDLLFEWDFGDGSPISNAREVEHYYNKTGAYDVSLVITNNLSGCQIGFQIDSMIQIFPTPTAEITADVSLCHPDTAIISYTHFIDSSICMWSFEGAHQLGDGNESITVMLDQPIGKAILKVDEYGCVSQAAEVSLKRLPRFDFYPDIYEGCQPLQIEATADAEDNFLEFEWFNDTLQNLTGSSNVYFYTDTGHFDIGIKATSQETGCSDTLLKSDLIWVHPKPIANFEVDYPVALLENATITYTNLSQHGDYFLWDFGDSYTSIEKEPVHSFTELGEFTSQLFVESVYDCKDTTEFLITILPYTVFTPNAFRPNSEIEENRTFMPLGLGADPSRFNLKIYDRWGILVFETNSPDNAWDGTTKKGEPAPTGNYIWISQYYDIQGYEHNQKGQVVLIR